MRDKSMGILLIVLFGISGIAVLLLAWLGTVLASDRITATLAGSAGIFIASTQAFMLRRSPPRKHHELFPAKVEAKDKG